MMTHQEAINQAIRALDWQGNSASADNKAASSQRAEAWLKIAKAIRKGQAMPK